MLWRRSKEIESNLTHRVRNLAVAHEPQSGCVHFLNESKTGATALRLENLRNSYLG